MEATFPSATRAWMGRVFTHQELRQGRGGDALAPELPPEPVADAQLAGVLPGDDVPGHLPVEEDGPEDGRPVGHDLRPVGHELGAGGECGHPRGLRVELLLEEDRQVALLHGAQ